MIEGETSLLGGRMGLVKGLRQGSLCCAQECPVCLEHGLAGQRGGAKHAKGLAPHELSKGLTFGP